MPVAGGRQVACGFWDHVARAAKGRTAQSQATRSRCRSARRNAASRRSPKEAATGKLGPQFSPETETHSWRSLTAANCGTVEAAGFRTSLSFDSPRQGAQNGYASCPLLGVADIDQRCRIVRDTVGWLFLAFAVVITATAAMIVYEANDAMVVPPCHT
jgi:hypothetical protein